MSKHLLRSNHLSNRYDSLMEHKAELERLEIVLKTEQGVLQQEKKASEIMTAENQKLREELQRYLSPESRAPLNMFLVTLPNTRKLASP